jgi:hypothetical protein
MTSDQQEVMMRPVRQSRRKRVERGARNAIKTN